MSSSISASAAAAPAPSVAKTTPVSYLFQLPVFGSPVCLGVLKKDTDERLTQIQKGVEGYFEEYPKKHLRLHPMFCESNPRWELADRLLAIATKVYVNENGMNECSVNSGTINTNPYQQAGGCRHPQQNKAILVC